MSSAPAPSPFDSHGRQFAWDSTSIKLAEACPRKYQYTMIESWTTSALSVHLWFGGLYAKALETYHNLVAAGADREEALASIIRDTLISSWSHDKDDDGNPIPETGGPTRFDDDKKTRENLIRTIVWYFEFFANDPLQTFITAAGKAAVEYSFRLDVGNDLIFSGHIDRLAVDTAGEIFVTDQKTTGQTLGGYYFDQFKPDSQFSMYTFAAQSIYSVPVKGVMIDAAQVVIGFSNFARAPTYRTDVELNEWFDETMELIERMRGYSFSNFFPRNPASCGNYGGCVFRPICSRPPHVREAFLKSNYIKREPWNPLAQR